MSLNQPRKIYRFQRFSARTVELLCNDELHFANPATFNDPLDCQPTVESDSDRDTLRLLLTELIRRRVEAETLASLKNARLQGEKVLEHAKKLGEQAARSELANIAYNATNPEHGDSKIENERWLLIAKIQNELKKRYDRGVCCFSATFRNPLLWSHYGDQHRGLCIGYSLARKQKPRLRKVVYGGSRKVMTSLIARALLNNDSEAQELLDRDVLLRKATPWRYELEWRLFDNVGVRDSVLALKDVTFGLRCSYSLIYAVVAALDTRDEKVDFFQMDEVRGSFKLKRSPVDTGEMRAFLPRTAGFWEDAFGPINED